MQTTESSRSATLLSLIAVILAAGAFKEELGNIYLWQESWTALQILATFSLLYGFLLAVQLLVDLSAETPGFRFLQKYSQQINTIISTLLAISIVVILGFSIAILLLNTLALPVIGNVLIAMILFGPLLILVYRQFTGLLHEINALKKVASKAKILNTKRQPDDTGKT